MEHATRTNLTHENEGVIVKVSISDKIRLLHDQLTKQVLYEKMYLLWVKCATEKITRRKHRDTAPDRRKQLSPKDKFAHLVNIWETGPRKGQPIKILGDHPGYGIIEGMIETGKYHVRNLESGYQSALEEKSFECIDIKVRHQNGFYEGTIMMGSNFHMTTVDHKVQMVDVEWKRTKKANKQRKIVRRPNKRTELKKTQMVSSQ